MDWSEISEFNGVHRITFNQKKTTKLQYLDIPPQAYSLINSFEKKGRVFQSLRYSAYMNIELLRWAMAAGISKHITFHSGRHTEAKTTQIYADIIDSDRKDAMHKIPDIGL